MSDSTGHTAQVCGLLHSGIGNQLFVIAAARSLAERPEFTLTGGSTELRDSGCIPVSELFPAGGLFINPDESPLSMGVWRYGLLKLLNLNLRFSGSNHHVQFHRSASQAVPRLSAGLISLVSGLRTDVVSSPGALRLVGRNSKEKRVVLAGYFQDWRIPDQSGMRDWMNGCLFAEPPIWIGELAKEAQSEVPIVVQVRMGDYRTTTSMGALAGPYFERGIRLLRETRPESRLWLFSDDIDRAIDSCSALKSDKDLRVIDSVDKPHWLIKAMSFGKAFVLSNSTFGWWGAFLSGEPRNNVVMPSPWFPGGSRGTNLIWPEAQTLAR